MPHLIPPKLCKGDTIGIFTPSTPAYLFNEEKFILGTKVLERLGYKIKIGKLTIKRATQGYRSGTGKERAEEFMDLYLDPKVTCLIAVIGGTNSNSMIPFLDFKKIKQNPKIVCGYSDMTSLHLGLLHYSKLRTFYGPALMTWFSEYPEGEASTIQSFLQAVTETSKKKRVLAPFPQWSNHFREWGNGEWKDKPRVWQKNEGWKVLSKGEATGKILVLNLNTLMSAAGTPYFPKVKDKILLLEEMSAPFSRVERSLMQLRLMGVFDQIDGLIWGKPENLDAEGASFGLDDLLLEIVGKRNYPIVSNFDLSHTCPMHTLAQLTKIQLVAKKDFDVRFKILEAMVK